MFYYKGAIHFLLTMPKKFLYPATGFSCQLESHRCEANTRTGNQCRRRAVIGSSPALCWNHLLKEKHLRIATSLLANAGKGLFAFDITKDVGEIVFKRGDYIVEYGGEPITQDVLNQRYGIGTAPYGVEVKKGRSFEDGACRRGVGSHSNTFVRNQNARLGIGRGGIVKLYATKVIRNGEEIYVGYGKAYKYAGHVTR